MQTLVNNVLQQIESVVLGKPHEVKLALACLLAKGHILIEDLPGLGKTTLSYVLAKTLGLSYQRVQFTSDLLPADVIGLSIYDNNKQAFTFHQGPLFNQVVLADEINRASPKTQSALLEAMEEGQVSVDGTTHKLSKPFFVIATQNPLFHAGTYPLPESQLDRFMMQLSLGFPNRSAEKQILSSDDNQQMLAKLKSCLTVEQLLSIQQSVTEITAKETILDYIISLCQYTRDNQHRLNPLSPRAGKSLLAAAKAWAYIDGRSYVIHEDVQAVFAAVCHHRMYGVHSNQVDNGQQENILQQVDPLFIHN